MKQRMVLSGCIAVILFCSAVKAIELDPLEKPSAVPKPLKYLTAKKYDPMRRYDFPAMSKTKGKATGFFHVEKRGDRWCLVDPRGYDYWFTCMLGLGDLGERKFSDDADETIKNLQEWGFTGMGIKTGDRAHALMPYTLIMGFFGTFTAWDFDGLTEYKLNDAKSWHDLPNVFHPDWPAHCDLEAKTYCAKLKDSPWLIGYQLANERCWYETDADGRTLAAAAWRRPASDSAKQAFVEFVRKRHGSIESFNRIWKTSFADWNALLKDENPLPPVVAEAEAEAWLWQAYVLDRFFSTTVEAIRRHDPNHLILGIRQNSFDNPRMFRPPFWKVMGKYCDIISINCYPKFVDPEHGVPQSFMAKIRGLSELAGRPLMISEWHPESDRERVYKHYQQFLASCEVMVGSQFFKWTGHEHLNFKAPDGKPYPEFLRAAKAVNGNLVALRQEGKPEQFTFDDTPMRRRWKLERPKNIKQVKTPDRIEVPGLVLHLKQGNLKIERNGRAEGSFKPGFRQPVDGKNIALRSSASKIIEWREDDALVVTTLRMDSRENSNSDYTSIWEFWLPKDGSGWFAVRCLSVKNTDKHSWVVGGVSYPITPTIGGSPEGDIRVEMNHLNLLGWKDEQAGRGFGFFSKEPPLLGRSSVNKKSGSHLAQWYHEVNQSIVHDHSIEEPGGFVLYIDWTLDQDPGEIVRKLMDRCYESSPTKQAVSMPWNP